MDQPTRLPVAARTRLRTYTILGQLPLAEAIILIRDHYITRGTRRRFVYFSTDLTRRFEYGSGSSTNSGSVAGFAISLRSGRSLIRDNQSHCIRLSRDCAAWMAELQLPSDTTNANGSLVILIPARLALFATESSFI